ncbi:MAG: hypothetical protein J07AB43_14400 [Candidatus Nanosalina sp. J07AB43]|nr:MAG: hypothetical protein J07AB43_14400 [Candidatus Nanosalina sp. J07AB43]
MINLIQREYESAAEESTKELSKEFCCVEDELKHISIETK